MAKINKKDVSVKDPFGEVTRSAKVAKDQVKLLEASVKMMATAAKNIKGSLKGLAPNSGENVRKINAETSKANVIAKERERMQKRLNILNSTAIQKNAELNEQLKLQRKTNTRLAKDKLGLISAYQKESKRLVDLRNQYKKLSLENRANTKEGRKLLKNVQQLDRKLKKLDTTVGQSQRHVGDYGRAVKRLRGGMLRLAGAFGLVGGIAAFARGIRNAFNKIVEFQKANTDLAGVLGKTRGEINELIRDSKALGSSTRFTATQVAGLQKEFAKLGFSAKEILNVTGATLTLATATSTELPRAAEVVGNTLRAFQLGSQETARLVDVMTKSFNISALDMEKFSTAMSTVAPVANTAGFSIERTTAVLGTLASNGIDASTAGTALRNIFLELSKSGQSFEQAMTEINTSTNKNATALKLFGKRGAAVGTIIANNTEQIQEMNIELLNAGGTAEEVANEQMKTLEGQMLQMTSAWEGFIFSLESGDGVISKVIGSAIAKVTGLLNTLTELNTSQAGLVQKVSDAAGGLGSDKANDKMAQLNKGFENLNRTSEQLIEDQKLYSEGVKNASILSHEDLKIAKLIVRERKKGTSDFEIKLRLANAFRVQNERLTGLSAKELKIAKEKNAEVQKLTKLEAAAIEEKFGALLRLDPEKELGGGIISLAGFEESEIKDAQKRIEELKVEAGLSQGNFNQLTTAIGGVNETLTTLFDSKTEGELKDLMKAGIPQYQKDLIKLSLLAREARKEQDKLNGSLGAAGSGRKTINTRLRELQKQLKDNRLVAEKLVTETTEESNTELLALNKKGELLTTQIDKIKELLKLKKQNRKGDLEKIALLGAEFEAQKKLKAADPNQLSLEDRFFDEAKVERDLAIEKARIRLEFNQKELKINEDALMENFDIESKFFEESQRLRLEKITLENEMRALKFEETQEAVFKEEEDLRNEFLDKKINGEFKSTEEIEAAEKELNKKLIGLHIDRLENRKILLKSESLEYKQLANEIIELQQEQNDLDKTDSETVEEKYEFRRTVIGSYTNWFVSQTDKRIEKINQEIAAAQRQANILEGLAKNGNITARESLAEQDQIIAEANLRKERLEKRKQNILLVSSILNAYNSALESGDTPSEAFTSAITNTTVLTRFVEALPTFMDGIEDTGTHGQGVDGKGGFNAILHPNERVMTKEQNAKMGGLSNEDVAGIIEQHRYGHYITLAPKMAAEKGAGELAKEMISVRKAIENQEVQNIELAEITQTAMIIRKTVRQGNRVTHSRFKVN